MFVAMAPRIRIIGINKTATTKQRKPLEPESLQLLAMCDRKIIFGYCSQQFLLAVAYYYGKKAKLFF